MWTRKVQQFSHSTLGTTLPVEWTREHGIEKADEISLQRDGDVLTVLPTPRGAANTEARIDATDLDPETLDRVVTAQYVSGRSRLEVVHEDVLSTAQLDAIYATERRLLGVGLVEETPEAVDLLCSVNPNNFDVAELVRQLQQTTSTMRSRALKALAHANADLAARVEDRLQQVTKVFTLVRRLLTSAQRNPETTHTLGVAETSRLLGYQAVARSVYQTGLHAATIADVVTELAVDTTPDATAVRTLRTYGDAVDSLLDDAVQATVDREGECATTLTRESRQTTTHERDVRDALTVCQSPLLRTVFDALRESRRCALSIVDVATALSVGDDPAADYLTVRRTGDAL